MEAGVSSRSLEATAAAVIMAATSFWDSDSELWERDEWEELETRVGPSGCGEPSAELGGELDEPVRAIREALLLDLRFLAKLNNRPEKPLPLRLFLESLRAISSASASVRERELLSVRSPGVGCSLLPRLLPLEASEPITAALFLCARAGLSLRLKLL
jgi:hypothetical protein